MAAPAVSPPVAKVSALSPSNRRRSLNAMSPVASSPIDVISDPEVWMDEALSLIFHCTLSGLNHKHPNSKLEHGLFALRRLKQELTEDGEASERLQLRYVDRILLEVLPQMSHPDTALYFYSCFSKIKYQNHQILNKKDINRMTSLSMMMKSLMSFAHIFFASPKSSFPGQKNVPENVSSVQFGANQLLPLIDNAKLDEDDVEKKSFAMEVIKGCSDAQLRDIVTLMLTKGIPRFIGSKVLLKESQSEMMIAYRCLDALFGIPRVCELAVSLSAWLPKNVRNGRELEKNSLLGPFFSPSSYPDDPFVGDALLMNKTTREQIFPVFDRLRHRVGIIQASLKQSLLSCLKNKASRAAVTKFMVQVCNLNHSRTHMRPNYDSSSRSGFLINFGAVCVMLCEPVGKKLASIDANFCVKNSVGMNFDACTRLAMDEAQVEKRAQSLSTLENESFNTQIFWLTARALSVGWRPAAHYYNLILQSLGERENQLGHLERIPDNDPTLQRDIKALRLKCSLLLKDKLAAEAHVKQVSFLNLMCMFYDMVAKWFTITADVERKGVWPEQPVPEVACIPEWLLEDLVFFYEWLSHHAVDILKDGTRHQNLLSFLTLLLGNENYVHSPHLRGRIVDVLQVLLPTKNNLLPIDMFEKNQFVVKMLIPGLINFYIDCERTGGNNQFYDKFSIRYRISDIIEYLWNLNSVFRESLIVVCNDHDLFLRFVTLLTNDATFLLDEAIHKLEEIHELEKAKDSGEWRRLPQEQQQEKEDNLRDLMRATRSYNLLSQATFKLFRNLSMEVVDPFMSPELIDRLAAMLDYFLVELAGPEMSNLKVKDPEAVNFDPKFLLQTLCSIYVNFGARGEFLQAIVHDERSYKQEVFVQSAQILRNRISGVSDQEIVGFESFVMGLESAAAALVDDEPWSDDDVPEEFQDPIMMSLMRDPVTWEGSSIICDRIVITRQLLNEPIDPYTRRPLTADELVPVPELKKKIDAWVAEQIKIAKQNKK
jgi:ubiquitin conjugation factor E4 B